MSAKPGDDRAALIAQTYLRPTLQGAATAQAWNKGKDNDGLTLPALMAELGKQVAAVNDGDLRRAEAMLVCQAHTLDAIFGNLARRASAQEYLRQFETYMRLGLKAQSQCRTTLETLANIKNPRPVAFVQQANITNGPQQVNNGGPAASRAANAENEQNKLLEVQSGERLDTATESSTGAAHSQLETVGAINRATDHERENGS